jgi:hypothetical protein
MSCKMYYEKDFDEVVLLGLNWEPLAEPNDELLSVQWKLDPVFGKVTEDLTGFKSSIVIKDGGKIGRDYPVTGLATFRYAGIRKATIIVNMVNKGL